MSTKTKKIPPHLRKQDNPTEGEFDVRFIAALTRPQFQKPKEEKTKFVLDGRFSSVLTDPKFSLQTDDKYGRRKKNRIEVDTKLKEFYTVEETSAEPAKLDAAEDHPIRGEDDINDDKLDENDIDEDKDPASRIAYLTALSRGEIDVSDSSDDDETFDSGTDDDDDECDPDLAREVQGEAGVLDPSIAQAEGLLLTNVPSPYMAILNMDWSHVRAVDILVILASFTSVGSVRKVQVYPSDYGLERIEKEKLSGPVDIWRVEKSTQVTHDPAQEEPDSDSSSNQDDESCDAAGKLRVPAIKFELSDDDLHPSFDPEKLRAYEASKLKYFFAIVEFASADAADAAYKEIDGLELEHSSASIDMRSIDPQDIQSVVQGRKLRDEASTIPSNYKPPEFVVNALQQTNVRCTWDEGDIERERKLTKYVSGQGWNEIADSEDLRAYIASDQSSDEDSDEDSDPEGGQKGSNLRKKLGLDNDDGEDEDNRVCVGDDSSEDDNDASLDGEKQISFVPGSESLLEKISAKVSRSQKTELTPWEKYQEKRRQKRREKRQARRAGRVGHEDENASDVDEEIDDDLDFFVDKEQNDFRTEKKSAKSKPEKMAVSPDQAFANRAPSTREELQLLMAGEEMDEQALDYDMRGLARMEKLKGQKLKGALKRKQEKLASNVAGGEFKLDTKDSRFVAVFNGENDLFGIDRTDPSFRDTEAMREILSMQTSQRKAKKRVKKEDVAPNVNADSNFEKISGASALSSLVKSLKSKVAKATMS